MTWVREHLRVVGAAALLVVLAAVLAAVLIPGGDGGSPQPAALSCGSSVYPSDPNGMVAYASNKGSSDGTFSTYTVTLSGSEPQLLCEGADEPAWSPDGKRVAFHARAGGVYVLEEGADEARFVAEGRRPAWSPDGTLTFVHDGSIYRLEPGGTPVMWLEGTGRPGRPTGVWPTRGERGSTSATRTAANASSQRAAAPPGRLRATGSPSTGRRGRPRALRG